MVKITIFSSHDGRLENDNSFYLTLFGGCTLVRPTIARMLIGRRAINRDAQVMMGRPYFLTVFGAVDIKAPTLSEEFIDLKELIRSGELTLDDWERSMVDLARPDAIYASFTLFGGFDECMLPNEEQEIDSLALQCHLGNIPDSARHVLQTGIGQGGSERRAVLHRAISSAAAVA